MADAKVLRAYFSVLLPQQAAKAQVIAMVGNDCREGSNMRYLDSGLAFSTSGPFGSKIFYAEPAPDVLNRVQFRVYTWQGPDDEEGGGGWWHFDSILQDADGIKVFTEVSYCGAELNLVVPWPAVDEACAEQRSEELYDEANAWKWVSGALLGPLGLKTLSGQQDEISDPEFQRELQKRGLAALVS